MFLVVEDSQLVSAEAYIIAESKPNWMPLVKTNAQRRIYVAKEMLALVNILCILQMFDLLRNLL